MSKKGLCLYHANCADGFAAALAVWMKYKDSYEYIPVQYGNPAPLVDGRDVLIVDFSYPREELLQLKEAAKSLLVIDHHKTAEKELAGLDFCIFDMNKSGAVLTYQYIFPGQAVPQLFLYIQDRDLWKWELPSSREVSAALRLEKQSFERWNELCVRSPILVLAMRGTSILAYQNSCVDFTLSNPVRTVDFCGYSVPFINCTHLISETVGRLAENAPFAVGYFETDSRRVYSLRSRKDGVDVAEIAKKFGGGGHAQAAGFWVPLLSLPLPGVTQTPKKEN